MKTFAIASAVLFGALLAYLSLWPVPIEPVAWQPPEDAGFVGDFAPNDDLAGVELIPLPDGHGPEDVDVDAQGRIYGGLHDGRILRWSADGTYEGVFADTGGRPLGLHWDDAGNLLVADALRGLLSIDPGGQITDLLSEVDGPMVFTDDLETTAEGVIYVSDASTRFDVHDWKLDIIESAPNGRLIRYDPADGSARVVLDELHFANGVAVDPDQQFVLVNETSRYRVQKLQIAGPSAGTSEVIIDNLPGLPDGISTGAEGRFWIAIPGPRDAAVDGTAGMPWARSMMARLPEAIQPAPKRYAHAVAIDASGQVICSLQDPAGRFAVVTSAQERDGVLYLGSLHEAALARIPIPDRCRR